MKKHVEIDLQEMDKRLRYWLDKVEDCYRQEVENSMDNFRREIGVKTDD